MPHASPHPGPTPSNHVDVAIIGAGISGLSAAYHIQKNCPSKSFALFERRGAVGGTWDLFRYPGIRSDSDMYTMAFSFNPWTKEETIGDGSTIRAYLEDTAKKFGIDKHIRFHRRINAAHWSSDTATWTLTAHNEHTGTMEQITANVVVFGSGYYNYNHGYSPNFPDADKFTGTVIHPQRWPQDLDITDKTIAVIGSGATAATLVPALAERAAHVTMIQRSPTYYISQPRKDPLITKLRKVLPAKWTNAIARWKYISLYTFVFGFARKHPETMKRRLIGRTGRQLSPRIDTATHFTPRYNPWQQRLCLVPDGDLFKALNSDTAGIVTGTIDRFTPNGIQMTAGEHITADIIVTATGLELQAFGGVEITVDGKVLKPEERRVYRGCMVEDVPNLTFTFGYTHASWTLKADVVSRFICRLLNHLDKTHTDYAVPHAAAPDTNIDSEYDPLVDFSSTYFKRAENKMLKQGKQAPWRLIQHYRKDKTALLQTDLEDGTLRFHRRAFDVKAK